MTVKMKNNEGKLLAGSVLGFLVMSMSLLLMPLQKLGFLPGILFWAGFLAGIAGQILLARTLQKHLSKVRGTRCGLLTFRANLWAKLADTGLAVSLPAAALALIICPTAYICYMMLAVAVFCFCLHCIFNGRVFCYVMRHDCSRRMPDHNN